MKKKIKSKRVSFDFLKSEHAVYGLERGGYGGSFTCSTTLPVRKHKHQLIGYTEMEGVRAKS